MKELEKILKEIECRKIVFDRNEVIRWLFEYAIECQLYTDEKIDNIILKKAKHMLTCADEMYQRYDRPLRLELFSSDVIREVARKDYGSYKAVKK